MGFRSLGLEILMYFGCFFSHTSFHDFAGDVFFGVESGPIGPWDRVLDTSSRSSQFDSPVAGFAAVCPRLEQEFMSSRINHDVAFFHFGFGNLFAVVANQISGINSRFGELPGIPNNAHASLHISSMVSIGVVGDMSVHPLHRPANCILSVHAPQSGDQQDSQNDDSLHCYKCRLMIIVVIFGASQIGAVNATKTKLETNKIKFEWQKNSNQNKIQLKRKEQGIMKGIRWM